MADPAVILIACPLEEHVARLRALAPGRLPVLHDPALLPAPRFAGGQSFSNSAQAGSSPWHIASSALMPKA